MPRKKAVAPGPLAAKIPSQTTGAATPDAVASGFCVNDHRWAHAFFRSKVDPKVIENRAFKFSPGWWAVSLSLTTHTTIAEELEFRKNDQSFSTLHFPKGVVLGLVKFGYSLPQDAVEGNKWAASQYKIANIITEVLPFDKPFGPRVRGNVGAFPLCPQAAAAAQSLARTEIAAGNLRVHAAATLPPPGQPAPGGAAQTFKAVEKTTHKKEGARANKPAPKPQTGASSKRPAEEVSASAPSAKKQAVGDIRSFFG